MAPPALAATENRIAMNSPGLPRYFLQISENSRTSPCFAKGTVNRKSNQLIRSQDLSRAGKDLCFMKGRIKA